MKKTKIKLNINDYETENYGFIKENILLLNTENETITYIIDKNILIKETKDNIIKLDFNNNKLNYFLKEYKKNIKTNLNTKQINISNNNINIIYEIENNIFNLNINYEVKNEN